MQELQRRVEVLDDAERAQFAEAHEAMAWALDAERVLESFNRGERGGFPVESVDEVTNHLLAWLDARGYVLAPKSKRTPQVPEDPQ